MTVDLSNASSSLKCVLLDIEGTTTPIDFVFKTLFPFARARMKEYLTRSWASAELQADIAQLRVEQAADSAQGLNPPALVGESSAEQIESAVAYIHWLMDRDRKSTPLKAIQGRIWQEGYLAGELLSEVFDDVPLAFARWREQNRLICIYSSGSALAQKLLFAHTNAGDFTGYISRYFDTTIGHKTDASSYRRIADELRLAPTEVVFISDAPAELDAADEAGMRTILAVRPGNRPIESQVWYLVSSDFTTLWFNQY
jgi:enolase-phosphatase E1